MELLGGLYGNPQTLTVTPSPTCPPEDSRCSEPRSHWAWQSCRRPVGMGPPQINRKEPQARRQQTVQHVSCGGKAQLDAGTHGHEGLEQVRLTGVRWEWIRRRVGARVPS